MHKSRNLTEERLETKQPAASHRVYLDIGAASVAAGLYQLSASKTAWEYAGSSAVTVSGLIMGAAAVYNLHHRRPEDTEPTEDNGHKLTIIEKDGSEHTLRIIEAEESNDGQI